MIRALLFLLIRSVRGRLVKGLRRLKEPRYLAGFLIGGGWIAFWVSRFLFRDSRDITVEFGITEAGLEQLAGPIGSGIQLVVCAVILIGFGLWWIVPFGKNSLEFTEPELHLLLPAPVSRRRLIQYAILKSQPGVLIGVTIVTVFSGPRTLLGTLIAFLGLWALFTIWDLHAKARGLWLARLDELPRLTAWRRRLLLWVTILALWLALLIGGYQVGTALIADVDPAAFEEDVGAALVELVPPHVEAARNGILGWVLAPLLWLTTPFFLGFTDPTPLRVVASWTIPAVVLLLHAEWVVRSRVGFEESALAEARRRARSADPAAKFWRRSRRARGWHPFPLAETASPETAIMWKNVMLVQRIPLASAFGAGLLLIAVVIALVATGAVPMLAAAILQAGAAILMLVPPLLSGRSLRNDLRTDLLRLETIRPWPVEGSRMFLAQIAAPTLLVMLQVLFGAVVLIGIDLVLPVGIISDSIGAKANIAESLRVSEGVLIPLLVVAYLPIALVVTALSTSLENLAALAFPGWMHLGMKKQQAASKFGQDILVFTALSLAMLMSMLPGALAVAIVLVTQIWFWDMPLSAWEAPLLGLVAALPIGAVVAALVGAGGRLWQNLDPSEEMLAGDA